MIFAVVRCLIDVEDTFGVGHDRGDEPERSVNVFGIIVCQRVRSDRTMDTVKILCISRMVESEKIADLRSAGANDLMQKPFTIDQLIERVCDQLDIERPVALV